MTFSDYILLGLYFFAVFSDFTVIKVNKTFVLEMCCTVECQCFRKLNTETIQDFLEVRDGFSDLGEDACLLLSEMFSVI